MSLSHQVVQLPQRVERNATGLVIPEGTSFEEWAALGEQLQSAERSLMWWIGDWWAFGSHAYGTRAQASAEGIFGRAFQTLMNAGSVCRSVRASRRREVLSWSHHAEVAGVDAAVADKILDSAESEGWSVRETRAAVKRLKAETKTAVHAENAPTEATTQEASVSKASAPEITSESTTSEDQLRALQTAWNAADDLARSEFLAQNNLQVKPERRALRVSIPASALTSSQASEPAASAPPPAGAAAPSHNPLDPGPMPEFLRRTAELRA